MWTEPLQHCKKKKFEVVNKTTITGVPFSRKYYFSLFINILFNLLLLAVSLQLLVKIVSTPFFCVFDFMLLQNLNKFVSKKPKSCCNYVSNFALRLEGSISTVRNQSYDRCDPTINTYTNTDSNKRIQTHTHTKSKTHKQSHDLHYIFCFRSFSLVKF